ncbi:MAG: hypothetical protein ACEPOZ_13360 [Marinifilaceae bacterium]|jgi:hypothetical protein
MKKNIGVWLDTEKAYIISLIEGEAHVETVKSEVESRVRFPGETKNYSRLGSMVVNPQKKITQRKKHQLKHYFDDICKRIRDAEEIYLFGPADAKLHLSKHLSKDPQLNRRVCRVESEDHITENQMIARVKSIFQTRPAKVRARH